MIGKTCGVTSEELAMELARLGRYTVLCHNGFNYHPAPEPPNEHNTTDTIEGARELFRAWLQASGNDYARAEGHGAPFADVVPTANWDGISYGDITGGDGVCLLERTREGQIEQAPY